MTEPVPTVLATELPDTVPWAALAITAALAGPPVAYPVSPTASSVSQSPIPVLFRKAAKIMKRKMKVEETLMGTPRMPSALIQLWVVMRRMEKPRWDKKPGK